MLRSRALPLVARHVARPRWYATAATATSPSSSPIVPAVPQQGVSHWKTADHVRLSRDNFIDLLYGKTPLIKETNFLSPTECWEYEKALSPLLQPYKHNTGPILRKVGLAQFEYQAQTAQDFKNRSDEQDQYFEDAKPWLDYHEKMKNERGLDAWHRVFNTITTMFPEWDVQVASEGPDRKYFSGIFRALNDATHLHCDFSPYDSLTEEWIINSVQCQVVFNLYLAPVKGGRTIVHDVQWTQDCLEYRDPESYGYHRDMLKGANKVYCEPTVGALCMFNSRNMHEVEHVEIEDMPALNLPYRPRLTLSSFMGLIPSSKTKGKPRLIFWS